jgi:hypothetical protein
MPAGFIRAGSGWKLYRLARARHPAAPLMLHLPED